VLDALTGARVFLKAETLQRTGSFKFRGAYNKLVQIPQNQRAGGVVAYSSGNHAQGVAAAAQLLGLPAVIVMPSDAPRAKRESNAALSGTICDALMAQMPGVLTFAINRTLVREGIVASDDEVAGAVGFAFRELKLVVEPGGAVALAALMSGRLDIKGKIVV